MAFSLKSLTTKNKDRGSLVTIYSEPGWGKTTLATEIIKDLGGFIISGEDGLSSLRIEDILHTPVIESWTEFQGYLESAALEDHGHKVVVIDTIDAMMPLLTDHVINTYYDGSMTKANAFKAYYTEMYQEFSTVLKVLNLILNKGCHVIVLCHSVIATVRQPDSEPFNAYDLALGGGAKTSLSDALVAASDFVLFGKFDIVVSEQRAKGSNRVLMTQFNPAYVAKSRRGGIPKLLCDWSVIKKELGL
jgi:hypothetical protein